MYLYYYYVVIILQNISQQFHIRLFQNKSQCFRLQNSLIFFLTYEIAKILRSCKTNDFYEIFTIHHRFLKVNRCIIILSTIINTVLLTRSYKAKINVTHKKKKKKTITLYKSHCSVSNRRFV